MNTKEIKRLIEEKSQDKSLLNYISLGISTVGVGYLPLAPGTWGSGVGILVYLMVRHFEGAILSDFVQKNFQIMVIYAWIYVELVS